MTIFPLKQLHDISGTPLRTLESWRKMDNRQAYLSLLNSAASAIETTSSGYNDTAKSLLFSDLSPEQVADALGLPKLVRLQGIGVNNMTLRRWYQNSESHQLAKAMLVGLQYQTLMELAVGRVGGIKDLLEKLQCLGITPADIVGLAYEDKETVLKLIKAITS